MKSIARRQERDGRRSRTPEGGSPVGFLIGFLVFILIFALITVGLRGLVLSLLERLPVLFSGEGGTELPSVGAENGTPHRIVVLDAGHGGEDGGTSAADGTKEKDLNLSTALLLADLLRAGGIEVVLTRDSDRLLYDPLSDYRGRKKLLDQRERLRIATETAEAHPDAEVLFVSIHMNSYPSESVRGLQVWYSRNNAASGALAKSIRDSAETLLQPENKKEIKAAGDSIFLLDRITEPAVLVECGFLSTPAECERLCDPVYQQKLALVLFDAICENMSAHP